VFESVEGFRGERDLKMVYLQEYKVHPYWWIHDV
jgi:hypothetical protein